MDNIKNLNVTNKLIGIARSMEKVGDLMLSRFDLTMRTYEILINIDQGVNTNQELSKRMQSTPASIAQKTKILEKKRLIKRVVAKRDKRVWYFFHTKKGQEIFKHVQYIWKLADPHLYSQYSEKEKQLIMDFIRKTDEHLTFILQNRGKIDEFMNTFSNLGKGGKNE